MEGARPAGLWHEASGATAGGGGGEPTLLLLHGLGATAEVWRGLAAVAAGRWAGRVLLVDLPGPDRRP